MQRRNPPSADYWLGVYEANVWRAREPARRVIRVVFDLLHSEDGSSHAFSVRDVASLAGVGPSTAWRVIEKLEQVGVLSHHGSRYRHHWPPKPKVRSRVSLG
jgi:hypothetical protein